MKGICPSSRNLKKHESDNTVRTVSADFGFVTRVGESKSKPFLVFRDHQSWVTVNHQAQGKSTTNELYSKYVINSLMQDLRCLDHKKLILKTDRGRREFEFYAAPQANSRRSSRIAPLGNISPTGLSRKLCRSQRV